jgi:hypothetical protein
MRLRKSGRHRYISMPYSWWWWRRLRAAGGSLTAHRQRAARAGTAPHLVTCHRCCTRSPAAPPAFKSEKSKVTSHFRQLQTALQTSASDFNFRLQTCATCFRLQSGSVQPFTPQRGPWLRPESSLTCSLLPLASRLLTHIAIATAGNAACRKPGSSPGQPLQSQSHSQHGPVQFQF